MTEPLLTLAELLTQLNVNKTTYYDWRNKGIAPKGYRVGAGLRFKQSEVDAWLASRAIEVPPSR